MSATHINETLLNVKNDIMNEIHHTILWKYTGKPVIQDEQLFFMMLPFLNGKLFDEQQKQNVKAVAIVHASLAEHEKIKEHSAFEKDQQLTVLSGDYYSGMYYQLLAKAGNIQLIQSLAKGIVLRCEQHIKVYEAILIDQHHFNSMIEIVESELIINYFNVIGATEYTPIVKEALTVIGLKAIYEDVKQNESKIIFTKIIDNGTSILELEQLIEARKQNLQKLLTSSTLKDTLQKVIEEYCLS
jgi:heptaprenyl diphosphate synthase